MSFDFFFLPSLSTGVASPSSLLQAAGAAAHVSDNARNNRVRSDANIAQGCTITFVRSTGPIALFLAMTLVGCGDGDLGSVNETERADAGRDTTTTIVDSATVVPDTAVADAAPEVTVDTAPMTTDADAPPPHVCPASSAPMDCSPGTGTGTGAECADAPSCYLSIVQKTINDIVTAHPDWFDFTGPGGCPVIKDVNTFLNTVITDITAKGLCAKRDPNAPDEEITLKKDNAFTENFDIVSSAGCARSGGGIYTGYCAPAWW